MHFAVILRNRAGCFVPNHDLGTTPTAERPRRAEDSGCLAPSTLLESSYNFAFCPQGERLLGRLTSVTSFIASSATDPAARPHATLCASVSLLTLYQFFSLRNQSFRRLFLSRCVILSVAFLLFSSSLGTVDL